MVRLAVFAAALAFVVGFAFLTINAIAKQGHLTVAGVLSLLVIAVLGIGILGALLHPPR